MRVSACVLRAGPCTRERHGQRHGPDGGRDLVLATQRHPQTLEPLPPGLLVEALPPALRNQVAQVPARAGACVLVTGVGGGRSGAGQGSARHTRRPQRMRTVRWPGAGRSGQRGPRARPLRPRPAPPGRAWSAPGARRAGPCSQQPEPPVPTAPGACSASGRFFSPGRRRRRVARGEAGSRASAGAARLCVREWSHECTRVRVRMHARPHA